MLVSNAPVNATAELSDMSNAHAPSKPARRVIRPQDIRLSRRDSGADDHDLLASSVGTMASPSKKDSLTVPKHSYSIPQNSNDSDDADSDDSYNTEHKQEAVNRFIDDIHSKIEDRNIPQNTSKYCL